MIAGLVLAAGLSRRMAQPKLLLPVEGGKPLARLTVERILAADLDEVIVVLGTEADAVTEALGSLAVRTVINPRPADGQSTSLRVGLDALAAETEAAGVGLGDQPLPVPSRIGRLVANFGATGRQHVVPRYGSR